MSKDDRDARPKPELTAVGRDPRDDRRIPDAGSAEIPIGFEMLLFRAAQDREFCQRLLSDREGAIAESGVQLRPSERAMMATLPAPTLARMIERLAPDTPQRRWFMGNVAAAVASLAAGTAAFGTVGACSDDADPDGGSTTTTSSSDTSATTSSPSSSSTSSTTSISQGGNMVGGIEPGGGGWGGGGGGAGGAGGGG